MRPSTALKILHAALEGQQPEAIAATLHLGKQIVTDVLDAAGWPDLDAVRAYRLHQPTVEGVAGVRRIARDIAAGAKAVRVSPDWIHQYTADLDPEEMREVIAVAFAMLPEDLDWRDALAWIDSGPKVGRPRKEAAA